MFKPVQEVTTGATYVYTSCWCPSSILSSVTVLTELLYFSSATEPRLPFSDVTNTIDSRGANRLRTKTKNTSDAGRPYCFQNSAIFMVISVAVQCAVNIVFRNFSIGSKTAKGK